MLFSNAMVAVAAGLYAAADARRGPMSELTSLGEAKYLSSITALVIVVASGTLVAYGLDRLTENQRGENAPTPPQNNDAPPLESAAPGVRRQWLWQRHRTVTRVTAVALLAGLIAVPFTPRAAWPAMIWAGVLSAAYALPCLPARRRRPVAASLSVWRLIRLRDVPYAKAFAVAAAWALATSLAPSSAAGQTEDARLWLGMERFLFVLAAALPFDVRDLGRDREEGVRTIPSAVGVGRTRMLVGFTLAAHVAVALGSGLTPLWAILAPAVILMALVLALTERRGEIYYLLGIDGAMALHGAILISSVLMRQ